MCALAALSIGVLKERVWIEAGFIPVPVEPQRRGTSGVTVDRGADVWPARMVLLAVRARTTSGFGD